MLFIFLRSTNWVCWIVLSLLLVACQSADPGDDSEDSPDIPVTKVLDDQDIFDEDVINDTESGRGEIDSSNGEESISVNAAALSFERLISRAGDPQPQRVKVSFEGDGVIIGYAPGVEPPGWLNISKTNYQSDNSPVEISFEANPYNIPAGLYETTVRLATGRVDNQFEVIEETVVYVDLPVSLRVLNHLYIMDEKVNLYSTSTSPKRKSASARLDGGWEVNWQASTEQNWISLINDSGNLFDDEILHFEVEASQLTPGVHTGSIRVQDQSYSGLFRTIEVVFSVDEPALMATDVSAAFVDASALDEGESRLSKTVTMISDGTKPISWQTSTNQSWLTATASGYSGDSLTINADPTGLTPGQLYYGEVSIESSAAAPVQPIKVGLYLTDDNAQESLHYPLSNDVSVHLAADPVRPYLYMTSEAGYIDRIQIYTGELDRIDDLGEKLRHIVLSDDGSRAYVIDNSSADIKVFSVPDFSPLDQWAIERVEMYSESYSQLAYQRVFNKELILSPAKTIRDADTGEILVEPLDGHNYNSNLRYDVARYAVVADGESFYMSDTLTGSGGGDYLYRHELNYSLLSGVLEDVQTHSYDGDWLYGWGWSSVYDIGVDQTGNNIYLSMYPELLRYQFDGESLTAHGPVTDDYLSSVEFDQENRMYSSGGGGIRKVFTADGQELTDIDFTGSIHSISGDNRRVFGYSIDTLNISFIREI